MSLRDRGKLKWLPAHFMPEHRSQLRKLDRDSNRQAKPLLDEYEFNEFDQRICHAMEFNLPVIITKWTDGFTNEEKGYVHYSDPIQKELRMKSEDGAVVQIKFADITGIEVVDD